MKVYGDNCYIVSEAGDGIHEIEDIYITPGGLKQTTEVPHTAGVN